MSKKNKGISFSKIKKNAEKEQIDLTKLRNDRCVPVAQRLLQIVAESKPLMGDATPDEMMAHYAETAKKVLQAYLDADLEVGDCDYIKQLALQPFDWTFNVVANSVNANLKSMQVKTLGKEVAKLTMTELDGILKG